MTLNGTDLVELSASGSAEVGRVVQALRQAAVDLERLSSSDAVSPWMTPGEPSPARSADALAVLLVDPAGMVVHAFTEPEFGEAEALPGRSVSELVTVGSATLRWPPAGQETYEVATLHHPGGTRIGVRIHITPWAEHPGFVVVCRTPCAGLPSGDAAARLQREMAAWRTITDKLLVSSSIAEAVDAILAEVVKLTYLPSALIYLYDEVARELRVAACQGMSDDFVAAVDHVKPGEGFSGRVYLSAEPIVVQDVSRDWRLTRPVVREHDLHSYGCFPLIGHGRVLGTLGMIGPETRLFCDEEVEFLAGVGRQIGFLLEMAERAYGPWSKARLLQPRPQQERQLSERERTVLRHLVGGLSPKQIALRLSISEKTVRNHISGMYAKLPVSDRGQLILWAVSQGLASPESVRCEPTNNVLNKALL